jgi:hypothetical protein
MKLGLRAKRGRLEQAALGDVKHGDVLREGAEVIYDLIGHGVTIAVVIYIGLHLRSQLRALKGTVEAQKATIDAQAELMKAQRTVRSCRATVRVMRRVLSTPVSVRNMILSAGLTWGGHRFTHLRMGVC